MFTLIMNLRSYQLGFVLLLQIYPFQKILYFLCSLFLVIDAAADYREKIWNNITNTYVSAIGGRWKKSGSGSDEVHKYPLLEAMSSLKPFANTRASNAATNITTEYVENKENSTLDNGGDKEVKVKADDSSDVQSCRSFSFCPDGGDNFSVTKKPVTPNEKENVTKKGTKRWLARVSKKKVLIKHWM